MPVEGDIILVTEMPEFAMADGELQFVLTSGGRRRVFRISKHRARGAIHLALHLLNEDDRRPCNVRAFERRKKPAPVHS